MNRLFPCFGKRQFFEKLRGKSLCCVDIFCCINDVHLFPGVFSGCRVLWRICEAVSCLNILRLFCLGLQFFEDCAADMLRRRLAMQLPKSQAAVK